MTGRVNVGQVRSTVTRVLDRVLDQPDLIERVRRMSAATMVELIRQVGLEDAGEIVALASSAQLARLVDEDVWVSGPGVEQEELSADRFALWLEVIAEGGDEAMAERLASLPFETVVLGFSKLIVVVNDDWLERTVMGLSEEDAEELEKRLDGFSQEQWQEFRVLSRVERHWDTAWSALLSLDTRYGEELRSILEYCEGLSRELLSESDRIDEVFDALDELEEAARGGRDERRSREGYVALQDARAFLRLATSGLDYDSARDPVSQAYFRELEQTGPGRSGTKARAKSSGTWVGRLTAVGDEASVAKAVAEKRLYAVALSELTVLEPDVGSVRKSEVAYLVNVLLSGTQPVEQKLRPVEALEVVVQVLSSGLLAQLGANTGAETRSSSVQVVADVPADQLFRIGWRRESELDAWVQSWRKRIIESL